MSQFNYQRYLASREWALLKKQVRARSNGNCERGHLQTTKATAVHHLTYERIGHEDLADLQHVCEPCHEFLSGVSDSDPVRRSLPERTLLIEQRHAAASPGPWGWWDVSDSSGGWDGPDGMAMCTPRMWGLSREEDQMWCGPQVLEFCEGAALPTKADAAFIAHAWEDIGALLDENRRLRTALARLGSHP